MRKNINVIAKMCENGKVIPLQILWNDSLTLEIDKILVNLVTKKFIEYDTSSANIKTTLKPLQKKLYKQFQIHMAKVNETKQDETKSNSFKNIFEIFEKYLSFPCRFGIGHCLSVYRFFRNDPVSGHRCPVRQGYPCPGADHPQHPHSPGAGSADRRCRSGTIRSCDAKHPQ